MKLLDGIFYQIYWAEFPKGFRNRMYKDPFGVACGMSILFCPPTLFLIILLLRWLGVEYSLKLLFIAYYVVITGCFLIYFLWNKRYRRIVSNEKYSHRPYRIAALLYPVLCIGCMFALMMVMCFANQASSVTN